MIHVPTANARANGPEILERVSEIEAREKDAAHIPGSNGAGPMTDLRGYTVLNTTGHPVGTVEDVYVDPTTREPYFALLSLGNHALGMGNRSVLVNFDDIEVSADRQVRVRVVVS